MGFFGKLFGWLSGKKREAQLAAINAFKRQVFAVPLDDARREVLRHLDNRDKFRCMPANTQLALPRSVDALPPLVTDFFTRYETVEELNGDLRLSHDVVAISQLDNRFIVIGTDHEHFEILVQPGAETVYHSDGLEKEYGDGTIDEYPTLYHFLLFNFRFLES